MAMATLRTIGGSVVMTIPKTILEQAHLRSGAQVEIEYRDGHLVVEPRAKPKYTLAELLARGARYAEMWALQQAEEDDSTAEPATA